MAMGTTEHPRPNPTMGASPTTPPPPAPPKALGPNDRPPDVDTPWLPEDFDKVLILRCYPDANSTDEMRSLAMAAGTEALKLAKAARASVEMPIPDQPDQRDPKVKEREAKEWAAQHSGEPRPEPEPPPAPAPEPPKPESKASHH